MEWEFTVAQINRMIAKGELISEIKYKNYPNDVFVYDSYKTDYIGKRSGHSLASLVRRDCDFDQIKNDLLISK